MRLEAVELRRIGLSLVAPFETSFGVQTERDVLLVRVVTDVGEGWGECVAGEDPLYSPEYVDGAQQVMIQHLLPALFERDLSAADVETILRVSHCVGGLRNFANPSGPSPSSRRASAARSQSKLAWCSRTLSLVFRASRNTWAVCSMIDVKGIT
jgi:hypothetical protein